MVSTSLPARHEDIKKAPSGYDRACCNYIVYTCDIGVKPSRAIITLYTLIQVLSSKKTT